MSIQKLSVATLILASSSSYRKNLLARLGVNFESIAANIDEIQQEGESPTEFVQRLAQEKAAKVGHSHPNHLVIGSDQCALISGRILGKSENRETAIAQLQAASGSEIEYLTGVTVMHAKSGWSRKCVESFYVQFRDLTLAEIERYVDAEKPFNCAGSFMSERLGVALCRSMRGDDPTTLIGLPLIRISQFLREFGLPVP